MTSHLSSGIFLSLFLSFYGFLSAQYYNNKLLYEELLKSYFEIEGPGAALLVAKQGKVIYQGAVGKANLELDINLERNHVFPIGSLTKQFTSVAVLMLQEQGKLSVEDDIRKYLSEYPSKKYPIRIKHLLSHTSGIPDFSDMPVWDENIHAILSTQEVLDLFKEETLLFPPGSAVSYSNSAYFLLGMIIEKVSGKTYPDFIQENIFDKAHMESAYYGDRSKLILKRVAGYQLGQKGYKNAPFIDMSLPFSAGALAMSISDFFKWNQALLAGKLINKKSLQLAHRGFILETGDKTKNGFGWGIGSFFGQKILEHTGSLPGFLSVASYIPAQDLLVVVFSNCDCKRLDPILSKILGVESGNYTLKKAMSLDQNLLETYVGIYGVDQKIKKIALKGDQMTFQVGEGSVYNIFPYEKDKFYFEDYLTLLTFQRNDQNEIVALLSKSTQGEEIATKTDQKIGIKKTMKIDEKLLKSYVGNYEMEAGFLIQISLMNGKLIGSSAGQPDMELFATHPTKFFVKELDAQLEFVKDEKGAFDIVHLEMGGQLIKGKRKL